jgi:4'-phosphopantetheinyl transferase EntD
VAKKSQVIEINMTKSCDVVSLLETWSQLLPSNIRVDAGDFSENIAPLTARELASAGTISPHRMQELQTGRAYAKHALSMMGVNDVELPIGSDRSPVWPAGFVGSITHARSHSREYCAAAVARSDEIRAIGIDAEYVTGLDPQVWPTILTVTELFQIRGLPANERESEVIHRWCIKEATAKAARELFEPSAIETEKRESEGDWFAFTPGLLGTRRWHARAAIANGLVLAAVVVPA